MMVASEVQTLPLNQELFLPYCRMIINNLSYCLEHNKIATFRKTVEIVAEANHVPVDQIHATLHQMLELGYLYQREHKLEFKKFIKVLGVNWDFLIRKGIWDPETMKAL